jgi:two-component system, OmpR family, sensor histidine kinase KdpD
MLEVVNDIAQTSLPVARWVALRSYVSSTLLVVAGTALFQAVQPLVGLEAANILLGYIVVVLLAAVTYGLGPAILASFLAFLAYNFFFVIPLHTLSVGNQQDVIRLAVFLGVAVLTSSIAARSRARAEEARYRARIQETLYTLSQAISAEVDLRTMLAMIADQVTKLLPVEGCMIVAYDHAQSPMTASSGIVGSEGTALVKPLQVGSRTLGVLRVWTAQVSFHAQDHRLLLALAQQAALAIERTRLVYDATRMEVVAESDRMKSTLLHSISHDLRTPLVAIRGAVGNLLDGDVTWTPEAEHALLHTIDVESERLNRLVRNLLDMSRIEAGVFLPHTEPALLEDVLGPVLERLRTTLARHEIVVNLPDDLPFVPMAVMQIDQVLTNLLENAARYAPQGTTITISAARVADSVQVDIADEGPGVPAAERDYIFEKFYRLSAPETSSGGTGLGLAIAKYIIEAHHGRIWTHPAPGGGAVFSFTLPFAPHMKQAQQIPVPGEHT